MSGVGTFTSSTRDALLIESMSRPMARLRLAGEALETGTPSIVIAVSSGPKPRTEIPVASASEE